MPHEGGLPTSQEHLKECTPCQQTGACGTMQKIQAHEKKLAEVRELASPTTAEQVVTNSPPVDPTPIVMSVTEGMKTEDLT